MSTNSKRARKLLAEPVNFLGFNPNFGRCHKHQRLVEQLTGDVEAAEARVQKLEETLRAVDHALRVPAAEYVPAIGDAFTLIDAALAPEQPEQPEPGK